MGKMIVLLTLFFAGCNSVGLTSSFCDARTGIEPFRPTAQERAALSSEIKRNMLRVNSYGRANCDWRP